MYLASWNQVRYYSVCVKAGLHSDRKVAYEINFESYFLRLF